MNADEAKSVGGLLRKIRLKRGLTLEVVAGLAGITAGFLSRVERGEAPLERHSHWKGVAAALGVPLWDLLRLELPAPGNGHTDSATVAVQDALDAAKAGYPGGELLPVSVLQQRVARAHKLDRQCRFREVGRVLPELIRDLHTALAAGRDLGTLLPLGVLLHVQLTRNWLAYAVAHIDVRRQAMFLAQDLAREHNEPTSLASAAFGLTQTLTIGGSFALAQTVLDKTTLPPVTRETAGLVCATLAAPRAMLLAVRGGDPTSPLGEATEIANRFGELGEADPLGFGYGPTFVGFRWIKARLELGEVDDAVQSLRTVQPERDPFRDSQAFYWRITGRALALAGGSVDEALGAYLRAEALLPVKLYRDPLHREMLRELLSRAPDNEQLQQLANRAGLVSRNGDSFTR
ncbi:MAG: helix-turn-helix domain-containing protein [Pseudonocardiaceae bacterium]